MDSLLTPPALDVALAEVAQPLLHYLRHYVGDPGVAEDLQQEALIRVARALPSFEGRSSLKTWAFAIANRVAADYFRHPERQAMIVGIDEAGSVPDAGPEIQARLVEAEMNQCIRQVIDSLPDTYRSALILHDLEGLPAEQVALACECTVANAKIRIHRARQRLKTALNNSCSFYHDGEGTYRCDRKD